MIKYKLKELKIIWLNFYNKNKGLIFFTGILLLIALFTGIFTSIKLYGLDNGIDLEDYSMYSLINGSVYSIKHCFLRLLSLVITSLLLFVFSLNGFLSIFGYLLIVYKAFLLTLNCTFIVISTGLSGIFIGIVIILPCQLLGLISLCLLFLLFRNINKDKKICGWVSLESKQSLLLLFSVIFLTGLVEGVLLLIFKPTTILIM